jgi:hypothetical protein
MVYGPGCLEIGALPTIPIPLNLTIIIRTIAAHIITTITTEAAPVMAGLAADITVDLTAGAAGTAAVIIDFGQGKR